MNLDRLGIVLHPRGGSLASDFREDLVIQRLWAWVSRQRTADPRWSVAGRTEIRSVAQERLDELSRGYAVGGPVDGLLVAVRHPTGWFVHGLRSASMSRAEAREFADLVTVRVFLLLHEGPRQPAWLPSADRRDWRAFSVARSGDLFAQIPDQLPAHW